MPLKPDSWVSLLYFPPKDLQFLPYSHTKKILSSLKMSSYVYFFILNTNILVLDVTILCLDYYKTLIFLQSALGHCNQSYFSMY